MMTRRRVDVEWYLIDARLNAMANITSVCLTNTTIVHIKVVGGAKIIIGTITHIVIVAIAKGTLVAVQGALFQIFHIRCMITAIVILITITYITI